MRRWITVTLLVGLVLALTGAVTRERASADHDIEHRIAEFWRRIDALQPADFVSAADLGQWARNVIERDSRARLTVTDFRSATAAMQGAIERAGPAVATATVPPTLSPTLTPTPSPVVSVQRLTVTSTGFFQSSGLWRMGLIARNHSQSEAAQRIYIDAYWYDAQGVRYETSGTAYIERIEPGQQVAHIGYLDPPAATPPPGVRLAVSIGTNSLLRWSAPLGCGLTVSNATLTPSASASSGGSVTGILTNSCGRAYRSINVTALGLDAQGNIVGGANDLIDIGANESTRFSLSYYGAAPSTLLTNATFTISTAYD